MDVSKYRKDHQDLLAQVELLQGSIQDVEGNIGEIPQLLAQMSAKLKIHLTTEDKVLYVNLASCGNQEAVALAKTMQTEMGGIKSAWDLYIEKWRISSNIINDKDTFISETNDIFAALAKRIDSEESTLYDLAAKYA
ncbi:MAG: hemerythrin domain-containing protein [Bdellovibrionales bacterium]|jgi:hypothetical protein|nr:hemerythrin domain-containing protein [Bdellovibrionales bacterium]MBT3524925.1 hemerythrin domain-containing protein [Bdellovibrionales bacterium]MBT7668129.1 hemerythrin domain-containing protein [Bdellovibrionales bacterium]MBT7767450.1 hemerythrin domain-containing protein [Bdellovibrionales bacterium]